MVVVVGCVWPVAQEQVSMNSAQPLGPPDGARDLARDCAEIWPQITISGRNLMRAQVARTASAARAAQGSQSAQVVAGCSLRSLATSQSLACWLDRRHAAWWWGRPGRPPVAEQRVATGGCGAADEQLPAAVWRTKPPEALSVFIIWPPLVRPPWRNSNRRILPINQSSCRYYDNNGRDEWNGRAQMRRARAFSRPETNEPYATTTRPPIQQRRARLSRHLLSTGFAPTRLELGPCLFTCSGPLALGEPASRQARPGPDPGSAIGRRPGCPL